MTLETKLNLKPETINALKELHRINIDSEKGLREAANDVEDLSVRQMFLNTADQRRMLASELANLLNINEVDPSSEGSYAAAFHRAWMKCREAVASNETYAILAEAERGEDVIKEAYESALRETAGSAANDLLTEQYALVKAGHDRIRDLRDQHKQD